MEKFTKIANLIYKKQQKLYNEVRMYLYKKEKQEKFLGKKVEILVEDISFDNKYYVGRTISNVPDIDGLVSILLYHL